MKTNQLKCTFLEQQQKYSLSAELPEPSVICHLPLCSSEPFICAAGLFIFSPLFSANASPFTQEQMNSVGQRCSPTKMRHNPKCFWSGDHKRQNNCSVLDRVTQTRVSQLNTDQTSNHSSVCWFLFRLISPRESTEITVLLQHHLTKQSNFLVV